MSSRELIAYALLMGLTIFVIAVIAWKKYHSIERTTQRRRTRDYQRYLSILEQKHQAEIREK